jgi:hypothetical protein
MKRVCIILVCLLGVSVRSPVLGQVPQSTNEIANTIGMCAIQVANLKEQLTAANAKVDALQKELDKFKEPKKK